VGVDKGLFYFGVVGVFTGVHQNHHSINTVAAQDKNTSSQIINSTF
jgi:hypothetical protein